MENNLNMVQSYNSTQLQNALSMLEPYMVLTQNNNRRFRSGTRLALSENFDDVSLKRTSLFDSTVTRSSFLNSALTGSYFSEVKFSDSVLGNQIFNIAVSFRPHFKMLKFIAPTSVIPTFLTQILRIRSLKDPRFLNYCLTNAILRTAFLPHQCWKTQFSFGVR